MPVFAVSLRLPASLTEEFLSIIPAHRAFINRLLSEHIIEAYAITLNRRLGWVVINGTDEEDVRTIIEQFPLFPLFEIVDVDELLIFDNAASQFPHISLN
jgi:hypothetical protein